MPQRTRREGRRRFGPLASLGFVALLCLIPLRAGADGFDLVMDEAGAAMGELATQFSLGTLAIHAEHKEYLAYLNASAEGTAEDPLARHSRFTASGRFSLDTGVDLPLGFEADYRSFASGLQEIDISIQSGLALPGLAVTNDLAMQRTFAETGEPGQNLDGSLSFGFDWLGARHEGRLDYELMPVTEATELALSSSWALTSAIEAAIDLSHRPGDSFSEAQLALNQAYGPFSLGTDFAADNLGGYSLGISLSLSLTPSPQAQEWRLSSLLAAVETRRPSSVQDSFGILAITSGE